MDRVRDSASSSHGLVQASPCSEVFLSTMEAFCDYGCAFSRRQPRYGAGCWRVTMMAWYDVRRGGLWRRGKRCIVLRETGKNEPSKVVAGVII